MLGSGLRSARRAATAAAGVRRPQQARCLSSSLNVDTKVAELDRRIKDENIDTVVVAYTDIYGRQMGKRYDAEDFIRSAAKSGAHSCTYVFGCDMAMEPREGFQFASWESGFGDFHMVPDLDSFTSCGWNPGTAMVQCDAFNGKTHEPVAIAPRSILRKQLARLKSLNWNEGKPESEQIGEIKAASELEHYLVEDSYKEAHAKGYTGLQPDGYYSMDYHMGQRTEDYHRRVRKSLRDSGVPVENSKGETGIGQYEVNVQYDEMLRMADRHMVFKQCMKEVALDMGKSVTFMAKPFGNDAGSSCHVHCSIVNSEGDNLFVGNETLDGIDNCSPLFGHFLAGWIKHTPDMFALYSPTVNSYKRHCAGSWAPTATAWGDDNRTAGFRIVGSGPALRIECRLPGADVNPYLVFAAAIASGLDGVENRLTPPPMLRGDGYAADKQVDLAPIPQSLGAAADIFSKSAFVNEVFGHQVQEHYSHFYKLEQEAYDKAVTDWERARYFEQI